MEPSVVHAYRSNVRGLASCRYTMCRLKFGMTFSASAIIASAYACLRWL